MVEFDHLDVLFVLIVLGNSLLSGQQDLQLFFQLFVLQLQRFALEARLFTPADFVPSEQFVVFLALGLVHYVSKGWYSVSFFGTGA